MKSKARLHRVEQAATAQRRSSQPRVFARYAGEPTGNMDGKTITVAEWQAIRRHEDREVVIEYVGEVIPGAALQGLQTAMRVMVTGGDAPAKNYVSPNGFDWYKESA